jgi:hypothetical protein
VGPRYSQTPHCPSRFQTVQECAEWAQCAGESDTGCRPVEAQGMCPSIHGADWARRVCIETARVRVENPSRTCYNHISMTPTRSTVCGSNFERVEYCQLHVRVQTNWAWALNRIHQT